MLCSAIPRRESTCRIRPLQEETGTAASAPPECAFSLYRRQTPLRQQRDCSPACRRGRRCGCIFLRQGSISLCKENGRLCALCCETRSIPPTGEVDTSMIPRRNTLVKPNQPRVEVRLRGCRFIQQGARRGSGDDLVCHINDTISFCRKMRQKGILIIVNQFFSIPWLV